MKKLAVTLTALSVMVSAHAATLDVHGDIKINGTTIITNKGVVVSTGSINIQKYMKSGNGVAILEGVEQEAKVKYEFTANATHFIEDKETKDDVVEWHGKWSDFTETSNSLTTYHKDQDGTDCKIIKTQTFKLSSAIPNASIGQKVSRIDIFDVASSTNTCYSKPVSYSSIEVIEMTPYKLIKWTNGNESYDDCLVHAYSRGPNQRQIRTSCVGVGPVEISHLDSWGSVTRTLKLTSFTPAG